MKWSPVVTGQLIMVNKNNSTPIIYKQLSILIAQDGFFFYLQHPFDVSSKAFEKIPIDDIFKENSLMLFKKQLKTICKQHIFKTVKLAFTDSNYSFVPSAYYDETFKMDYLKFNVQLLDEDHVMVDFIKEIDVYQIYIPLMNYHNVILDLVEEFDYQHFTNSLITESTPKQFDKLQKINVFISDTTLDVVAFEGLKFKLCNTFTYDTDYDLAYYILFAVEGLNFDQRKMQLNIYHNLNETPWLGILKTYVLNINCEQKALSSFIK